MSNNYYYFAASLPLIFFDSKPPMSMKTFLEEAGRFLSPEDYRVLKALLENNEEISLKQNSFISKWIKYNHAFANETASFRAERNKEDPKEHIYGERIIDPDIISLINHASKMDNLLEAEKYLDSAKWKFLDELSLNHYFDLDFILSYGLKLQILNRYQIVYSDLGKEKLESFKKVSI